MSDGQDREDRSKQWSPPADFNGATGAPAIDLCIKMLSSNSLGNDIIDLLGQLLSEKARFNIWYATEGDRKAGSWEESTRLTTTGNEATRRIYEAWTDFDEAYSTSCAKVGHFEAEEAVLKSALQGAIAEFIETRARFEHM